MFCVRNVTGYIANPGIGFGYWDLYIPVNDYRLKFSAFFDTYKLIKPQVVENYYKFRANVAPACYLPTDLNLHLYRTKDKNELHRIQFNLYFPTTETTDGMYFRTVINSVVDLKETIRPACINVQDLHDRLEKKMLVNSTYGMCSSTLDEWQSTAQKYREACKEIKTYAKNNEEETKMERRSRTYVNPTDRFRIKDILFNGPATVVIWMDGTKTVVKLQNDEVYDQEKAIAMAISRRALGEEGYYSVFHAKEFAEKELRKLQKLLSVLEDQYSQMSKRKKTSHHKSAVRLETRIKSCKKGIKHFEKIIKKFTPPETIEQVNESVDGKDLPPVAKN